MPAATRRLPNRQPVNPRMTPTVPAREPRHSRSGRCAVATSISRRVHGLVMDPGTPLCIESVFADACNIVAATGARFALVSKAIGDGPLNVVLDHSEPLAVMEAGDAVTCDGAALRVGPGWRIDLGAAAIWEPMPRYELLARRPAVARANLTWLLRNFAPQSPLVQPPNHGAAPVSGAFGGRPWNMVTQSLAGQAIHALRSAYGNDDAYRIRTAARRLAGLGPGLTPAGDDWLAGWLVGLRVQRIVEPDSGRGRLAIETVGRSVLQGASDQTTELSLAFLAAAVDGAAPQAWHQFIDALGSADPMQLQDAADQVVSVGATSGSDMLAGFLTPFDRPD